MIRFLHSRGHGYTVKKVRQSPLAPAISLMDYDALLRARWLRRGTYIFTDLDRLNRWDLELAAELYLQLQRAGLPVWNNPAKVKTRYPLLRTLHAAGLNDFNVHRADELSSAIRYPVFVRKAHGHGAPVSDLLPTRPELDQALAKAIAGGTPGENLLVIEFAAEPVRPGVFRKLSAFRIGNAIVPHISVHDTGWLVKMGRKFDNIEDLYLEEQTLLQTNPFAEQLRKVFELAEIEYGRADFGVYRGRLQIYEINTNPNLGPGEAHPSPTRVTNMRFVWEKYHAALRTLDSGGGWPVRLASGALQRHRPRKHLFVRSRIVP